MKQPLKTLAVLAALVLLFSAVCFPAAAEGETNIVNILLIGGEDMGGGGYFPLLPLVLSFDLNRHSVKVIYFYYETQITGVTSAGETISISMSLLPKLSDDEVVKAFETTFGIPIDRYLIYKYNCGKYTHTLEAFDLLAPLTIDVPEDVLGTAEYSTINGNMKSIAAANDREYTAVDAAGPQELDAVGYLGYIFAIPESVWASDDRYEVAMADYQDADTKNRAAVAALRLVLALAGEDTKAAFMRKFIEGQNTDITEDDIMLWSWAGLNLDAEDPYMSVPGFEGAELETCEIGSLAGVPTLQNQMLTYDNEVVKQRIREFLYGE